MVRARGALSRLLDRVFECWFRHEIAVPLVAAVVLPVLVVTASAGGVLHRAFGPQGAIGVAIGVVIVLVGMAAWLGQLVFASLGALAAWPRIVLWLAAGVAGMVAWAAASTAAGDWVMHARAEETPCVVLAVDERVETRTTTDSQGHSSTETYTYYDHRLDCVGDHPEEMTTSRPTVDQGERILVAYDPEGRLDPRPADGITDGRTWTWVCVGALAVNILLHTGQVVLGRGPARRRARRPGRRRN
jgi:hypothetical protein